MKQHIPKTRGRYTIHRIHPWKRNTSSLIEQVLSTSGWCTASSEPIAFATVKQAMHHIDKAIPNNAGLFVKGPKGGKYYYNKGGYESCEA